jgi:hypothetical protein
LKANNLSTEKSPYLQQHASNPVWWQPWGQAAFGTAQKENKLIFLSIGYSTCHWCHVMEHESFVDDEVAQALNKDFVCIKVDREELPDVDAMYMRSVQFMTGQGGWPMSVFLTPDLKPVFGGTYFPKDYFLRVLGKLNNTWATESDKIRQYGEEMIKALAAQPKVKSDQAFDLAITTKKFLEDTAKSFDPIYGGFGQAPKFPGAILIRALLEMLNSPNLIDQESKKLILQMVEKSLKSMASSGIYDQLGGGFSRYSTDERWCVPHFEKMLYDNAGLVISYLSAFKHTGDSFYVAVVKHTLEYLLRDMLSPEGAFYAAEDADSEGREGTFYVWSVNELRTVLSDEEFFKFSRFYEIPEGGNFEHGLLVLHGNSENLWTERVAGGLTPIEDKLRDYRSKRTRPFKDTKVITEWNGFAIEAFALAGKILKEQRYTVTAVKAALFIKNKLWNVAEQKLYRRCCDGQVKFNGVLDDYVFLISGVLTLFDVTKDKSLFMWAEDLQRVQDKLFWDESVGAYNYSANQNLILPKEFHDGATPNGNGVAFLNLIRFINYQEQSRGMADDSLQGRLRQFSTTLGQAFGGYPSAFSTLMMGKLRL